MYLRKLLSILSISVIVLGGCNPSPVSPPSASINPEIEITFGNDDIREVKSETIQQLNCDGTAELENTVERSYTVQHTLEVQGGIEVNANGHIGINGTDIGLGTTIASQLGYTYGTEDTISRSVTVKAAPKTNMEHRIRQAEIWKTGTATVAINGYDVIVPFQFRYDFKVESIGSHDLGCNGTVGPGTTSNLLQGCIASNLWTPVSNNKAALSQVELDANGCYLMEPLGMFAE